jgi:hypothetical protein
METEKDNNSRYYNLSESGIKKRNLSLWEKIDSIDLNISFKEKFYLIENNLSKAPVCYMKPVLIIFGAKMV